MSATRPAPARPRTRPSAAVYRRRRIVVSGVGALVLLLVFYVPLTTLAPLRAASAEPLEHSVPITAPASWSWPAYGAGAIAAVGYPGVLGQYGTTEPLPMASITKIVTAFVVLDRMPLAPGEAGPTYRTTAADAVLTAQLRAQNVRTAPLTAGIELSERQLLELSLIESASNYTRALVAWAIGDDATFASAAQHWLARQGLDGITVVEPTGLDPRNAATTTTLVALGKLALADPVISEIVAIDAAVVPGVGSIENTNKLLGKLGIDGIKTGTLLPTTANLLFSAVHPIGGSSIQVVGVLLGGPDHDVLARDVMALLGTIEAGFLEVPVVQAGEGFAAFTTVWGQSAVAVAATDATLLVWADAPVVAEVDIAQIRVGGAGDPIGQVTFSSGPASVTVPLLLSTGLSDPGPLWRMLNPAQLF